MKNPLEKDGNAIFVIEPTESWEIVGGPVTEGPWIIKHNNIYYLLYSGSGADRVIYSIGYTISNSPQGPFTKYLDNPIIKGDDTVFGLGHGCVIKLPSGELWHIYHQKKNKSVSWDRFICIDPLWFDSLDILHGLATRDIYMPGPQISNTLK